MCSSCILRTGHMWVVRSGSIQDKSLCRVAHLQTNGKLERIHDELQRKLSLFEDVARPPGSACPINPPRIEKDPIARFMKWYNYDRPHMSLDTTIEETPAMAFKRKMPPPGTEPADE